MDRFQKIKDAWRRNYGADYTDVDWMILEIDRLRKIEDELRSKKFGFDWAGEFHFNAAHLQLVANALDANPRPDAP